MASNPGHCKKRLIVCCDGTWLNSDNSPPKGFVKRLSNMGLTRSVRKLLRLLTGTSMDRDNGSDKGTSINNDYSAEGRPLRCLSNVARIFRCIEKEDDRGTLCHAGEYEDIWIPEPKKPFIPQISYYQAGLGASWDIVDHVFGGGVGKGLGEHIREAYAFIANNYVEQCNGENTDEICLIGFSRGAFTARSIAGFIDSVGILTGKGLIWFGTIFDDWAHQLDDEHESTWPKSQWSVPDVEGNEMGHSTADGPPAVAAKHHAYRRWLAERGFTREHAHIRAIGVWETVGSLGIPQLGIFEYRMHEHYRFINTHIPDIVENAFHALALDETRRPFLPTLWEDPENRLGPQSFKQVWFPGAHSDVGGSYEDGAAANITLAWMVQQLQRFIKFDYELVRLQYEQVKPAPWGLGPLHDPFSLFYRLFGKRSYRKPGENYRYDPETGHKTFEKLKNTNESIHACVRLREECEGAVSRTANRARWGRIGWHISRATGPPPVTLESTNLAEIHARQGMNTHHKLNLTLPEDELGPVEVEYLTTTLGANVPLDFP